ncbi:hypothetical protein C8R47DRAFT_427896 [Mycena vitilis]|nr:hypothetical protein C8R47DRAFT_427896 [Mycena vitilis]
MSTTDAHLLLAAAQKTILDAPDTAYDLDIRMRLSGIAPTNPSLGSGSDAQKFDRLCTHGRTIMVAHLEVHLHRILAPHNLATSAVLDKAVLQLIESLEEGNPTDSRSTRPPNMFCAVVGSLTAAWDLRRFETWLAEYLGDVLASIEEAAKKNRCSFARQRYNLPRNRDRHENGGSPRIRGVKVGLSLWWEVKKGGLSHVWQHPQTPHPGKKENNSIVPYRQG